jgi:hypothetical protein
MSTLRLLRDFILFTLKRDWIFMIPGHIFYGSIAEEQEDQGNR